MRFSKENCIFYVVEIETEKKKTNGKAKKPIKIVFFKVVIQKCEKWTFCKKLPDTICVRKGEKTHIFVHTICFGQNFFGPKQCKPRNTIKTVVSAEIARNQK